MVDTSRSLNWKLGNVTTSDDRWWSVMTRDLWQKPGMADLWDHITICSIFLLFNFGKMHFQHKQSLFFLMRSMQISNAVLLNMLLILQRRDRAQYSLLSKSSPHLGLHKKSAVVWRDQQEPSLKNRQIFRLLLSPPKNTISENEHQSKFSSRKPKVMCMEPTLGARDLMAAMAEILMLPFSVCVKRLK